MTQQQVIALIQQWIVANGNEEITADVLRPILEAMVNQPNDLIGDLNDLTTTNKDSVVDAINEVNNLSNGGITIHYGSDTPFTTPPVSFELGDFYAQLDGSSVLGFWQYNGNEWVEIKEDTLEGYYETGAREDGNLEVVIGDYDNSSGGTKITINDDDGVIFLEGFAEIRGYDGELRLTRRQDNKYVDLKASNVTDNRGFQFPDKSGTLALIEDIPNELTPDELAGIQNANGLNGANPVATIGDLLQNVTIVNIIDFGAVGNGTTESAQFIQDALDFAETNGIRRVYAPSGTYLLEQTVYIPNEIEFFGDGMEKTIFSINNSTEIDEIEMFSGNQNVRNFYNPVISTKTSRTGNTLNNILLRDFKIGDIDFDDTGRRGYLVPMLILNTHNSTIENVEFGNIETERDRNNERLVSVGLSVVFSENILIDRCIHGFAEYEGLSIRFICKNITSRNNIFYIDRPDTLQHMVHTVQVAIPHQDFIPLLEGDYGRHLCEYYTSNGDVFNLISNVTGAITSHTSIGVNIQNSIVNYTAPNRNFSVFRPFTISEEIIIKNNIINVTDSGIETESLYQNGIISIGAAALNYPNIENSKIVVSGNILNLELNRDVSTLSERNIAALIGNLMDVYLNASITDNVVNITGTGVRDQAVFGFYGANIIASGNVVNFDGTVSQNMRAFVIEGGDTINVVNNSVIGDHAYSLKINDVETLENLIVGANNFPEEVLNLRKDKTKTLSYNTEIASGTVINLDNPNGRTVDSPEYNATYTFNTDTIVRGGNETREITTLGETEFPEITGATLLAGSEFEADAIFEMIVYTLNGIDVYYFFLYIKHVSI